MSDPLSAADLLAVAETLLAVGGVHEDLACRRAVSTAYYAFFHAVAACCAETLLPDEPTTSDAYRRIYRALDHGPMRNAFGQPLLKDHVVFRRIGDVAIRLQSARNEADYAPLSSSSLTSAEAARLLDQCRSTLASISALALAERRVLATSLLFRTR